MPCNQRLGQAGGISGGGGGAGACRPTAPMPLVIECRWPAFFTSTVLGAALEPASDQEHGAQRPGAVPPRWHTFIAMRALQTTLGSGQHQAPCRQASRQNAPAVQGQPAQPQQRPS